MKHLITFCLAFLFCLSLSAQKERDSAVKYFTNDRAFNLGATIGFNTIFPIINSLTVDDIELEDIRLRYKVGYQVSLFGRLNMDRFFIQPSITWQHSEGDILFSIPVDLSESTAEFQTAQLEMNKQAILVPVHIGYHIIREAPYGLSFMVGPTFKYNYNVSYKPSYPGNDHEFISESNPFGMNIATGVSVRIWQLFFDFGYEFGLNQTESDFKSKLDQTSPALSKNIRIDKRTNVMSFSLGIVF